jgi:hypothetical protein
MQPAPPGSLRLLDEALLTGFIGHPLRRQDFDGDEPVQACVASLIYLAHAARAEGCNDLMRTETLTYQERHGIGSIVT